MFERVIEALYGFTFEEQKKIVDLYARQETMTEKNLDDLLNYVGDEEISWYIIKNYFHVKCISEKVLLSIIDAFGDDEITMYILQHHFQNGKN